MSDEIIDDNSKTFAEFDLKKTILQEAQEFSRSVTNRRVDKITGYKTANKQTHAKIVFNNYLRIFNNINTPKMLGKVSEEKKEFLKKYEKEFHKINTKVARRLDNIIKEILDKYGLTDMSSMGGETF